MADESDITPRTGQKKPQRPFPVTRPEDVYGVLRYEGPTKSISEMDAAVLEEAKRRHDRS